MRRLPVAELVQRIEPAARERTATVSTSRSRSAVAPL
jgi:hypothetical protein